MTVRLPNLLIFLFGMQFLVAMLAFQTDANFVFLHLSALFITLAYFAVLVFGLPKVAHLRYLPCQKLFSTSLFPFLQVVAADFWLAARAFHLPSPMVFIALMFIFSCLTLL